MVTPTVTNVDNYIPCVRAPFHTFRNTISDLVAHAYTIFPEGGDLFGKIVLVNHACPKYCSLQTHPKEQGTAHPQTSSSPRGGKIAKTSHQ